MMGRRARQPLSVKRIAALSEQGMYCDGNGLYLNVSRSGGKSWILRTTVHGKRCDFGLGSASLVTLAEARAKAHDRLRIARSGGNPKYPDGKPSLRFRDAAAQAYEANKGNWSSPKHGVRWWNSLERYVLPTLGEKYLEDITVQQIHGILQPIWTAKYDTARRVRQRVTLVFDWARGAGFYNRENPMNGIKRALPAVKRQVRSHPALPWKELPAFVASLRARSESPARLLELIILTGLRSKEARGARWDEFENDVWYLHAERMKARKAHRVPLSSQAFAIISGMQKVDPEFIFPSPNKTRSGERKPMSDMVFAQLMKRMGIENITTHGFRSTFKDWCSDSGRFDYELSELALAHSIGSAVERACARTDLFERRRTLMQEWGDYVTSGIPNKPRRKRLTRHTKN